MGSAGSSGDLGVILSDEGAVVGFCSIKGRLLAWAAVTEMGTGSVHTHLPSTPRQGLNGKSTQEPAKILVAAFVGREGRCKKSGIKESSPTDSHQEGRARLGPRSEHSAPSFGCVLPAQVHIPIK